MSTVQSITTALTSVAIVAGLVVLAIHGTITGEAVIGIFGAIIGGGGVGVAAHTATKTGANAATGNIDPPAKV